MALTAKTAWTAKGTIIIACNCDWGCPCNVNARPTYGHCEGGWTWHIEKGAYGDVKLDGLNVGLYSDWPKAIHEGNGVATYLVDARADEAQRTALQTLLEGQAGGPWGIFRKTFSELHGPRFVTYIVDEETQLPSVIADDALALEMAYIRNPVTGDTAHPRLVLPEGSILKDAALTATTKFVLRDEHVSYDHSGKYGAFGFFQYFGP